VIGDDVVTGAARLKARRLGLGVVVSNESALGDCSVDTPLVEFPCEIRDVVAGSEVPRDDVLGANDGSDGVLGNPELSVLLDALELSCAPPVLCTTPVRGSGVVDVSVVDEVPVVDDDVDETEVDGGEANPDGAVDTDGELGVRPDGLVLSVDEEVDELDDDELESVGSARATPGIVATTDPTPRATASAPTRPT
jgi:hypothetical protein